MSHRPSLHYQAPGWMPRAGAVAGHVHTIWPALFSKTHLSRRPHYQRWRATTPDGDFIDFDELLPQAQLAAPRQMTEAANRPAASAAAASNSNATKRPLLVLFHGLEGSSHSHYALAFADWAQRHGWDYIVPHFRGCSGELNLAPRAYHSGDHEEIAWMLAQCHERHGGPMVAVGVSLGGNALLRWAQEAGAQAQQLVQAVAAISSPINLTAGGHHIGRGFNRQVYTRMFLRTMKPRALAKLAQFPGLFDRAALLAARDLYAFDNVFTAPLHGFKNTDDYWHRASAVHRLADIRVPALVLNAVNDPFFPSSALPAPAQAGPYVQLWQPQDGGHVGFPSGRFPGHVCDLPKDVMGWMEQVRG